MEKTEEKYSSDEIKKFFGVKLKKLRQNVGMTRKQLAEKLGITEISVGNYERGLREPSLEKLIVLSNLFCVSIEELIGADDVLLKNKIIENYRIENWFGLISYGHWIVIETVDNEFFLFTEEFDLFKLMYSEENEFEKFEEFDELDVEGINEGIKLKGELVFFPSLDDLINFIEYLIFKSIRKSNKTIKENFSQIIGSFPTENKNYWNLKILPDEMLQDFLPKLQNGKRMRIPFHNPFFRLDVTPNATLSPMIKSR